MNPAETLIRRYYDAFNAGDADSFLDLLTDDVVHDINQGERETGRAAFGQFVNRMTRCYRERIVDLVVMTEASGAHAAAEFIVHGEYLAADEGLPPAHGQRYVLPAGAFFGLRDGKIARVSNFYNLQDWLLQVSPSKDLASHHE
jgi:steroid delta-isomerase-like uncharacterized protein